jgi:hypothetical protein
MSDAKQLKIEEYSLVDFVMKIQQGIRDGYEVTDQSDDAPLQIGGGFYTIMREAIKANVVVGKAVFEASLDTTKLQEQLKAGGEIEQMLADSLVVDEKVDKSEEVHGTLIGIIPITNAYVDDTPPPSPEPTLDEALPKEEQVALQTKQPTKRGKK